MSYKLINKVDDLVVTLPEIKEWLKLDDIGVVDDAILTALIKTATKTAEKKMNRDILTATWENYRKSFFNDMVLRRGPFQELLSIYYLSDGSYLLLPEDKYTVKDGGVFAEICEVDVPDFDDNCNAIKITFKSGYGDAPNSVPEDIKSAIKLHVAFLYENRGDCIRAGDLPLAAQFIYHGYEIIDIGGEDFLNGCVR